jgi:hypothetical protein
LNYRRNALLTNLGLIAGAEDLNTIVVMHHYNTTLGLIVGAKDLNYRRNASLEHDSWLDGKSTRIVLFKIIDRQ